MTRHVDWRRFISTGSRQTAIVLLLSVALLHLAPLVPPGPIFTLYGLGWLVAITTRRGRRNAFLTVLVLSILTLGAVALLGRVILPPQGSALEAHLPIVAYAMIPMILVVPLIFAWEWWVWRHRSGRVFFPVLVAASVLGLLWTEAGFRTDLLGHPWQYASLSLLLVILVGIHQLVVPPGDIHRPRARGSSGSVWFLTAVRDRPGTRGVAFARNAGMLALVMLLIFGVYRGWQDQAVAAGGGLLRPTLFRFDFADVISLESEIQLSRDLVLIYREDQPPEDRLLRRYVLSGYSPRRGFYRLDPQREPSPVPPLSAREAMRSGIPPASAAEEVPRPDPARSVQPGFSVKQEYYIVNFDPDALVSVVEPEEVRLRPQPPRSSFNSAYAVASRRPAAGHQELRNVPLPTNLPQDWREAYVDTPVPERVAALARDITRGITGYYDTVRALDEHLREEYFYSLVPGDAPDGDQLSHFLFESRKGYCSYFAFSLALMARSLGIPSRVAAGFFVVPDAGMLGFHPIRGDMAHAWVEVYFPGVGWVEFDPTSQTIAPGETFSVDYEIDRDRLAALVEEILAMPEAAEDQPGVETVEDRSAPFLQTVRRVVLDRWYLLVLVLFTAIILLRYERWRRLRSRDPSRAALLLFETTRRSLVFSGLSIPQSTPLAVTPEPLHRAGSLAVRARLGPDFSVSHLAALERECREVRRHRVGELRRSRRYVAAILLASRAVLPPRRVPGRTGVLASLLLPVVLFFVTTATPWVMAQVIPTPREDPEILEREIRRAVDAENFEEALRRIENARRAHPGESRFPLIEGDLYYSQELFELALHAYRDALEKGAGEYSTRYLLSRSLARLNRDEEASAQLETLLASWPDDTYVVGDLAWLYFKRHRLQDARELLEDTIERVGRERDLLMTLATVQAALYDYSASLDAYNEAITRARNEDDRFFQAVAYYNLSILHANFYRWDQALDTAEASLEATERSSGYMIRAELNHRRMNLDATVADYRRADVLDRDTPLPGLSLASLYAVTGYPDRTIRRMERILARENTNWMYSYGTDPDRYQLRVYAVLAEGWTAAARRDLLFRPGTPAERVRIGIRGLFNHLRAWYYRGMARRQSLKVARSFERQGRVLPAVRQRMVASEHLPLLARRYATRAEELETRFNPEARYDYELVRAVHERDAGAIRDLAAAFRSPWRRTDRTEALRELYRLEGHRSASGLSAAAEVYVYAPGSFLVHGLRIPVALHLESGDSTTVRERTVRRGLQRLGFRIVPDAPLHLEIQMEDREMNYRIVYTGGQARNAALSESSERTVLRRGSVRGVETILDGLEEMAEVLTTSPLPEETYQ